MRALGRSRPCSALLAALLARHAGVIAQAIETSSAAQTYLSEEFFPGLHLLDVSSDAVVAYPGGQLPRTLEPLGGFEPAVLKLPGSMAELRAALEIELAIPEREELQNPWLIYDRQGGLIDDLDTLRKAELAFVLEIGVWMWPAVKIGFQQFASDVGGKSAVLTTLSVRPKIFEVRNFLSVNETQAVMDLGAKQGLHNSKGMMQSKDRDKGTADADFRTSKQAWLHSRLDPLIAELDERVAELTRVPVRHQEPVQLLRYDEGTFYYAHNDWSELELYPDQEHMWARNHMGYQDRLATVFWYLNDVEEGGETNFPKMGQPICNPRHRGGPTVRQCPGTADHPSNECNHGLRVKPQRGSVVMWYNFHASGRGDINSLHAGCPVGKGLVKWSANKWIRIKDNAIPPKFVKDHPAMARFGWRGTNRPADPNECSIGFHNTASEEIEIMWKPEWGEGTSMGSLSSGGKRSMQSFRGHQFYAQAGSRKSNPVACTPPFTFTTLNSKFELREDRKEL